MMKELSLWLNRERVITISALLLLLVAVQVMTQDASDWFLLGLNILQATEFAGAQQLEQSLAEVIKVDADLGETSVALVELTIKLLGAS
ncbi:hypothetical protein [Shewanella psychrotolerans]|uniref:hypothetical protein n=1 Tax=Shewanella psychrotolerans TaxID=2864206 RepID=UPI001C659944|nr:hypothetical protein [Shewanella psychrotolerans]QYK00843.1 hypothetical protein K0I62_15840 [Shewanella psychrotolerans]